MSMFQDEAVPDMVPASKPLPFLSVVARLFPLAAASATQTHVVARDGSGGFTDIESAIDAASNGNVSILRPAAYVLDKPVNLKFVIMCGTGGHDVTTPEMGEPIDPDRASVFIFEGSGSSVSVLLESVTITGGRYPPGRFMRWR